MTKTGIAATSVRYSQSAQRERFAGVGTLPEDEAVTPRRILFTTILKTRNHPLVADRMWWAHMHKEVHSHKALNEVLYDEFEDLAAARG